MNHLIGILVVCACMVGDSVAGPVMRTDAGRVKAPPMREPVWVDLLMGRIYAVSAENVLASASGTVYVDISCYDSSAVLTERAVVDLAR